MASCESEGSETAYCPLTFLLVMVPLNKMNVLNVPHFLFCLKGPHEKGGAKAVGIRLVAFCVGRVPDHLSPPPTFTWGPEVLSHMVQAEGWAHAAAKHLPCPATSAQCGCLGSCTTTPSTSQLSQGSVSAPCCLRVHNHKICSGTTALIQS